MLGYALACLESEEDRDVTINVGFDDEISIRINSDVVHTGSQQHGFQEATFPVRLHAGKNRVLVKLSNEDNQNWRFWGFSLRKEDA